MIDTARPADYNRLKMKRVVRTLVFAGVLLTWEPFASLALGPLHLHEGETTPHRDHDSPDQPVIVASLPTAMLSATTITIQPWLKAAIPCPLEVPLITRSLCELPLLHGSRPPPTDLVGNSLPLLI